MGSGNGWLFGIPTIRNASNNIITTSSVGNRYFFTGREYDVETGLYYYRARYYDPSIGRFLSVDPIGYYDGLNLYSYCNNNPINFIDPWGLCKDKEKSWWEKARETLEYLYDWFVYGSTFGCADYWNQIGNQIIEDDPLFFHDIIIGMAIGTGIETPGMGLGGDAIVIGESMERVMQEAGKRGAKYYNARGRNPNNYMKNNRKWIQRVMDAGKKIIDIGIDPSRSRRSPYYNMEKQQIRKRGYPIINK